MTLRWRVATETLAATAASLCQKTRGDGGRTVTQNGLQLGDQGENKRKVLLTHSL